MAKYKTEKGFAVQTLSSDPAASIQSTGTWASGGNLNTSRWVVSGFAGTQTANLLMGGYSPSAPVAKTESYDGTTWTEKNDMNTSRRSIAGFGTYTAAIGADGRTTTSVNNVESWDGTNWTETTETNQSFEERGGSGCRSCRR